MKKRIYIALASSAMLLASFTASAQEDISQIFKAGINDVGYLAQEYMKPAGAGFAAGLGANWYNTAATHSVLGFDLTFGTSVAFVPTSNQSFSLSGLTNLTPNAGVTTAPTFGGSGDGVLLKLVQPATIMGVPNPKAGQVITQFTTPGGISKYIPSANVQLCLGLPLGTDVTVRYTPDVTVKGMNAGLWGVGIKHNVKQWIPVVNLLPFDASVMVAYTKFKLNYAFESQLDYTALVNDPNTIKAPAQNLSAGQGFTMEADALMANFIVSKSLLFFTPYVGVGVTRTNFNLSFDGVYPLLGAPITTPGADFGKFTVDYYPNATTALPKVTYSEVMPGATVGFRLKLFFITALHAQYTFQKYPTASVGFGINFR
ncbi:MAG: hypothetical protein PHV20_04660 [Bacteroidales bacterium]|nr:hypothetical protein [Bacteroidales bacterium]